MDVSSFDYPLPEACIAQTPAEPRSSSRLLDTRDLSDHRFVHLPGLLRSGDLVVVNRTKVRPARLKGVKEVTGGRVEALLLRRLDDVVWAAMVRPARRLRAGDRLRFGHVSAVVLVDPVEGIAKLEIAGSPDIEADLRVVGEMPLPPYISGGLEDSERYQTVFADRIGSAAAPTAGLHFTTEVLHELAAKEIAVTSVDLEVGLATFRPIGVDRVEDHVMHRERCQIDATAAGAIASCRSRGGRVVAIGTTVVRTLETFARSDGLVSIGEADTDLYLTPGAPIMVVDLLVTNFHMPRSSLLVLLETFMGPRWRTAYELALQRQYRFLSFGDAMICERLAAPGRSAAAD